MGKVTVEPPQYISNPCENEVDGILEKKRVQIGTRRALLSPQQLHAR